MYSISNKLCKISTLFWWLYNWKFTNITIKNFLAPCRNGDSRTSHLIRGEEIMDIERDRRKAEKRRAKKKRRKEKKKLEKLENKYSGKVLLQG